MGQTTFSGPVRAGTVREGSGENAGLVVLSQTATLAHTDSSAKDLFVLPANSQVVDFYVDVTTVFNGTSPGIDIGKTGTANHFADNLTANAVGRVLGSGDASQVPNYQDIGTSDVTVTATSVATGSPTTGAATITCVYIQKAA